MWFREGAYALPMTVCFQDFLPEAFKASRIFENYEVNVCHCTVKIWNGCYSLSASEPFSCTGFFFMLHNLFTGEIKILFD